jgi:predicted DsbA family dithiol-disulfide isomerase
MKLRQIAVSTAFIVTIVFLIHIICVGEKSFSHASVKTNKMETNKAMKKMKVEIWSDVVCPFCYIGKRKFDKALAQFKDSAYIEVEWKSFQLMPDMKTDPQLTIHQLLAKKLGVGLQQATSMNDQVANTAKQEGLVYNFNKSIPANTFNAHRLSHLAKHYGLQDKAEELLFSAYFTDGKNIDDINTLVQIAGETGLDTTEARQVLAGNQYADEVKQDIKEAGQLGARGVPFFVMDRSVAVSGAQDSKAFLKTLEQAFAEWRKNNPAAKLEMIEGQSCKPEGSCD